jgi:lactoylglutathione lyase
MTALRIEIFPADLDRTVHFYCDVLGFALVRDERGEPSPYVAFQLGDAHVGAARRAPQDIAGRRPPIGVELVLEVDDLRAAWSRVRTAHWPVEEELTARPWGLTDFRILDPSGYYWRLTGPSSFGED